MVSVTTKVVFGSSAAINARLKTITSGRKINPSFGERMTLTFRHLVSRPFWT